MKLGLLARYRRSWGPLLLAALAMPMVMQMLQPSAISSDEEARILSTAPAWPTSLDDWRALPRGIDRYLADHFGFRTELVRAHGRLRYAVNLPGDLRVLIGRDNYLFLNGDATIEQATGKRLRANEIAKFADRAAALKARLAAKGAQLLVAIPPNGPTINRARLPAWAAESPAMTEYDLMLRALSERGVTAVDLRPPLLAANASNPVYRRTDTHWNKLGALIGFNAAVSALGKPDWVIEPARVLRGFVPVEGGDLARLLAISDAVSDEDADIDLTPYGPRSFEVAQAVTQFESGGDLIETGGAGPTVVVIGDSFTRGFWQDYFALRAGRYVWMHHEQCGFMLSVVESYAPDIVILAPTERQMFCTGR